MEQKPSWEAKYHLKILTVMSLQCLWPKCSLLFLQEPTICLLCRIMFASFLFCSCKNEPMCNQKLM